MGKIKQRRKRGVVLNHEGLEKIESARLKSEYENNWGERYTYEKLSELSTLDINTIKRILTAKEGVDKRSLESFFLAFNLKLTPEHYTKPNPHKRQDLEEAICVSDFYGRTSELDTLEKLLLRDRCRLVTVLGMGGVGKTSLSVKLAKQVQDRFDCILWRSLRDLPPLKELLASIIQFLSEEQETEADLPENIGGRITRLIDYLRSLRCLIVFDNLESLLCGKDKAGFYKEGYEEYGEFLKRLGETDHQSCILITTREKPKQIAALEGEILPVRTLRLKGLNQKEGAKILKIKGLCGSESDILTLVEHYEGNALALKIVATTIRDIFDGNIQEFLCEKTSVFGDIRELLEQQFQRLSSLEKDLIYWLAINREPVSISELREDMIFTTSRLSLVEGLELLFRRSLIEQHEARFTLQSVVMEYVNCKLIEKVCQEIDTKKLEFLRCYTLMKATAKDHVKETQVRLILKPIINGLLAIFGTTKNIEQRLAQFLKTQQKISPREPGYLSGNIVNLLCQMEIDLKGYDFSNLCLWQVDLRNVCLHSVNFQNSDLARSVFAETFGGIFALAFSPDGKILAAGDTKGNIFLRRLLDDQIIHSFKGHNSWVVSLAFSPDGNTLASSSCDCTAKLWDVKTNRCLHVLEKHNHEVWSVVFSPDGKILASGCDDSQVRLWQVSTGKCLKVFQGHSNYVLSVVFSLDGKKLFSGSHDHTIKVWDVETGKDNKIFRGHDSGVRSLSVSPDGQILASGSNDSTVRLWDIQTGECLKVLHGHSNGVWVVTFCHDSKLLASGSIDHTVRLWDIQTGECLKVLHGHSNWINSVAFSLQDNCLASGSYDQTIKLWNTKTYKCLKTFQGYSNQVLSVSFNPNGQTLVGGGHDQKIRLWDVRTGQVLQLFGEHQNWIWSTAFSPQGNFLASGSGDQTVRLWDVNTGKEIRVFRGHQAVVRSVIFHSNNQIIASASEDKTIRLWDINTGQTLKVLQGHQAEIWSTAFSPDGRVLLSGSLDGTAKLWNVQTGKCLHTLKDHTSWVWSVAFSPDNETVATTSPDQTIRIWNVKNGKCQKLFQKGMGCSLLVAFSVDGKLIASCNQDHKIRLWNISDGKCFRVLSGHKAVINSIDFCPDNHKLVSSSEDETIKLWDLKRGKCLKSIRIEKPYEGLNITGTTSLNNMRINALKMLGATTN